MSRAFVKEPEGDEAGNGQQERERQKCQRLLSAQESRKEPWNDWHLMATLIVDND